MGHLAYLKDHRDIVADKVIGTDKSSNNFEFKDLKWQNGGHEIKDFFIDAVSHQNEIDFRKMKLLSSQQYVCK